MGRLLVRQQREVEGSARAPQALFKLSMDTSNYYRQYWYWWGEAHYRTTGGKLELTTIPEAEWKKIEDEANKFWDEIAAKSARNAKVVEILQQVRRDHAQGRPSLPLRLTPAPQAPGQRRRRPPTSGRLCCWCGETLSSRADRGSSRTRVAAVRRRRRPPQRRLPPPRPPRLRHTRPRGRTCGGPRLRRTSGSAGGR